MSDKLIQLLGDTLMSDKDTPLEAAAALGDAEHIGIYFSAHWCPPCRRFTPQLAKMYTTLRGDGKKFQVVFVSSDKSIEQYNEYFGEMPWLAVPFEDRARKGSLAGEFEVSGIPRLVIVDRAGNVVNESATMDVMKDNTGAKYPWVPPTIFDLLGDEVEGKDGAKVSVASLRDKVFAVYLSAHWCPPCRQFTPRLIECYNNLKAAGKEFEVIFGSNDQDEDQYDEYYREMPWLTLGYEDDRVQEVMGRHGVRGIPSLLVFDGTDGGRLITESGVGRVASDVAGAEFPWEPRAVNPLADASNEQLNAKQCFVVLTKGEDTAVVEAMKAVAEDRKASGKPAVLFFHDSGAESGLADRLRSMFSLTGDRAAVLLKLPSYYPYPEAQELSVEGMAAFLAKADAKELEGKSLA